MSVPVWDIDVARRLQHGERRFDLDVRFASDQRQVVLFGPSGAGKSQTLQLVAGFAAPDRGHVRIGGRTLVDTAAGACVPARDRRLGYVFQDYALFPHLTVAQNIAFGLDTGWRNPSRAQDHPQVRRWLQNFDLTPLAHLHPEQLSGGQRQRTALARALAPGPAALLLDEPFAALDTALRARLRDELADLLADLSLPMVLITHDDADVRRLGHAVFVLGDGRVLPES